ncbi:hypothetical protein MJO28_017212 [Puccinia striiformis f. sp. tritici]|uniref:Glutathione synthetase n=1 Tax=Puccinia striiformis TaxID=27350 RepID=A0A2S4V932_9BASI|nr:hypothetical protein Pst134EA_015778 [Puccinia striiformis f. sp. tritici]KAH9463693.1 hypothetical protein Pst134EA_015778 [Puccinia striiformis f. sp. tritici]KAI7934265.1 hypothetical protein MJO28_017212 [Puccinia striiformis f. sp. tritici]POW05960.1 hypothetical protein PSTT_09372 [Puccinia striiformis]
MATCQLPSWPEELSPGHLNELQRAGAIYALANSLILKLPSQTGGIHASHVPFTLLPSPFPRDQFEKATRIQTAYNQLYLNIASSPGLIREVLGKSICKVDPFVGRLYELWEALEKEQAEDLVDEHFSLGIFRNDFLLHQSEPDKPLLIKQVEFNTVSVSFGSLASKVSGLHRYLGGQTSIFDRSQLPESPNQALHSICKALQLAHQHYVAKASPKNTSPAILMIVKPNENNIFDQSLIEFQLDSEQNPIRVIRLSCHEILKFTTVDPTTKKIFYLDANKRTEVSVVYYRSMYGPEDFTGEDDWKGRYQLERSRAINCPSLAIHLAGCKKFQQILTVPQFLDRHDGLLRANIEPSEWEELRSTWTSIYSLEDPSGFQIATDPNQAIDFVLKPQREGGGNNIYGSKIPDFVARLSAIERESYILMSLIKTPPKVFNYLIRSTATNPTTKSPEPETSKTPMPTEIISELGIYGFAMLSRKRNPKNSSPQTTDQTSSEISTNKLMFNFQAGHILRTKDARSGEGGVAIGISCLDSPLLI